MKKSKKSLVEVLDGEFSMYVRLRDARDDGYIECVSCHRVLPFKEFDCGHYIPRANSSVRFDERNCNAQCKDCNQYKSGNLEEYRLGLIERYGEDVVLELEAKKHEMAKLDDDWLKVRIAYYRQENRRLKKEKL